MHFSVSPENTAGRLGHFLQQRTVMPFTRLLSSLKAEWTINDPLSLVFPCHFRTKLIAMFKPIAEIFKKAVSQFATWVVVFDTW